MPRVIFKCPHIKPGVKKAAAHRNNYVRYVATRDGVERVDPGQALKSVTKKQAKLVERLLRDFPESRELFEYADYQAAPTRENASEFISRAIEDNYEQIARRENYVDYIANRPRVQKLGTHGLFSAGDTPLALSQVAEEVAQHPGVVWLPIISLRRLDAARLGYDNAQRWRTLLSQYAPDMAKAMKIPCEQFRWYAAFHDEGHHPHVHMVCCSVDSRSGFLTRQGIADIKSMLAKEIFQQDLVAIYQRQTQRRDELTKDAGETMRQFVAEMQAGTLDNQRIDQLMTDLARRLRDRSGKKQYGYLPPAMKSLVDEIVDELAKDPRVAAAYDLWYEQREEVLRTYKDDLPDRIPLSQQKEFKRIRNLVIEEAVRLGEQGEVFAPTDTVEPDLDPEQEQAADELSRLTRAAEAGLSDAQYALGKRYRDGNGVEKDTLQAVIWFSAAAERGSSYAAYALGKLYLAGEDVPKNVKAALRWLQRSAELGSQYAQYALGKLCLLGKDVPQDRDAAARWFTLAAARGNEYARHALERMRGQPSLLSGVTRLLHHMGHIFQEQGSQPAVSIRVTVDSKLRRKLREKKIAMGHKADDHEEQTQKLQ